MKILLLSIFMLLYIHAETNAMTTTGDNSPIIKDTKGNVYVTYHVMRPSGEKPLYVLDATVPSFNENEADTKVVVNLFNDLFKHNNEIVYIRFDTYVGGSIGLKDKMPSSYGDIRAGVVFELDDWLDGFGGKRSNYRYGYVIESTDGSITWDGARYSMLLFPDNYNAFFNVNYSSSFQFEGLAKIKITGLHGMMWIEIIPTLPVGDLKLAYDEVVKKLSSTTDEVVKKQSSTTDDRLPVYDPWPEYPY